MGNEIQRWDEAPLRVLPADEGFHTNNSPSCQLDFGLVIEHKLIQIESAAKILGLWPVEHRARFRPSFGVRFVGVGNCSGREIAMLMAGENPRRVPERFTPKVSQLQLVRRQSRHFLEKSDFLF